MPTFALEKLKAIREDGVLSFYKVSMNGICLFDQFLDELLKSKIDERKLKKLYSYMNYMAETNCQLPAKKFNSIKKGQKVFGYEFKEDDLRIYVIKIDPRVVVVLGGYKKTQPKDLNTLFDILITKDLKGFLSKLVLEK